MQYGLQLDLNDMMNADCTDMQLWPFSGFLCNAIRFKMEIK